MRVRLTILLVGVLLAAASGSAYVMAQSEPEDSSDRDRSLRTAFAVFREEGGQPADASEAAKMGRAVESLGGSWDRGVVRLARDAAGAKIYVGAGGRSVCLGVRDRRGVGSLGCSPIADPERPLVAIDLVARDTWRVSALVVDGVGDVQIEAANRDRLPVPVANNVFTIEVSGIPRSLAWIAPDGSRHVMTFDNVDL
jgi:hypothetical protein